MQQITKPTLLLNEKIARSNIQKMVDKAQKNGIPLRPHFKTHVSLEIGEWFKDAGVKQCTVSSVEMAKYFASEWDNITIAFPFNRLEIGEVNQLAANINLNLVIEDLDTLLFLEKNLTSSINYLIKLDVGTNRTGLGVSYDFDSLIKRNDLLNFNGFLAHAGHAYRCRSNDEIRTVYHEVNQQLANLKSRYPKASITYGDTPTCSIIQEFDQVDELRAGNFVFYDWMQLEITSCSFDQIAVCMAVPVVAKHKERNEIVFHGGAVHFSKDQVTNPAGENIFGALVKLTESGWEKMEHTHYMTKASQEHGIITVSDPEDFEQIQVGDIIGVIPAHSCLTANLMAKYTTLNGKDLFHMNWTR